MRRDFDDLLRDLERLANSPRPRPKVAVMMKKFEPAQPPTFVWQGRTPRIDLQPGIVIEGEPR